MICLQIIQKYLHFKRHLKYTWIFIGGNERNVTIKGIEPLLLQGGDVKPLHPKTIVCTQWVPAKMHGARSAECLPKRSCLIGRRPQSSLGVIFPLPLIAEPLPQLNSHTPSLAVPAALPPGPCMWLAHSRPNLSRRNSGDFSLWLKNERHMRTVLFASCLSCIMTLS